MIPGRVRVRDLIRTPGATHQERGTVRLRPVGLTTARLDEADASYDVMLEAEGGRIHITGTARAGWSGECRRCLEPTRGELDIPVSEIFEAHPTEGETWPIDDGEIDLGPALGQALVLELPIAPLCRTDCAGPDPERYPTAPVPDDDDVSGPVTDPRWAALEALHLEDPSGVAEDESDDAPAHRKASRDE